jgi:hypothetical protein
LPVTNFSGSRLKLDRISFAGLNEAATSHATG